MPEPRTHLLKTKKKKRNWLETAEIHWHEQACISHVNCPNSRVRRTTWKLQTLHSAKMTRREKPLHAVLAARAGTRVTWTCGSGHLLIWPQAKNISSLQIIFWIACEFPYPIKWLKGQELSPHLSGATLAGMKRDQGLSPEWAQVLMLSGNEKFWDDLGCLFLLPVKSLSSP